MKASLVWSWPTFRLTDNMQHSPTLLSSLSSHDKTPLAEAIPPMNVLIVDDGETNRRMVSVYLERANASFDTAENGKIAIEKVNAGNFDVVLMDMHMPVMDGFEATKLLRRQGHKIPIIALTANITTDDKKQCFAAGCSGFVAKPVNREQLLSGLSLAVAGSTDMQEEAAAALASRAEVPKVTPQTFGTGELIGSSLPMDDEDFVYISQLFVNGLYPKVEGMVNAILGHNFDDLVSLGHWLKGASGSAGYEPLSNPGLLLESAAKDQNFERCLEVVREICQMASRVHVKAELQHSPN